MLKTAATARNIRLMVENIIMPHKGVAHHFEHDAQGTPPHHGFSLFISVEFACVEHCTRVLYSVRRLKSITFPIE